jgi:predicted RNA-binding Zn-ribbon protein involved in translation (DUF1610 family)
MTQESRRLWLEAGILLSENPAAVVLCPECRNDYLHTQDCRNGDVVEREMSCPSCGSRNYLRLVRPLDSLE